MLTTIDETVTYLGRTLFDTRTAHCRLAAVALSGTKCTLTGTILDRSTLTRLLEALGTHHPQIEFDTSAVHILRSPAAEWLTVLTNLTGLHREPSRTSEMMSEVLSSWQVEPLLTEGDWTYVRQEDGYLGWVHTAYLGQWSAPAPTHVISTPVARLRAQPNSTSLLVGRVLGGTAVAPEKTHSTGWHFLHMPGDLEGWIQSRAVRAIDAIPASTTERREQIVEDARTLIGVPYRWGGCSAMGIDCSGLSQLVHRLAGIILPRDADMQFAAGRPVEPPFQPGDLLFFGSSRGHRTISHVGIAVGEWRIIHSSGPRNGVYEDNVQKVTWLRDAFRGARTFLPAE